MYTDRRLPASTIPEPAGGLVAAWRQLMDGSNGIIKKLVIRSELVLVSCSNAKPDTGDGIYLHADYCIILILKNKIINNDIIPFINNGHRRARNGSK